MRKIYLFKCDKCQFLSKNTSDKSEHMREEHSILKWDNCDLASSSDVSLKTYTTKSHVKSRLELLYSKNVSSVIQILEIITTFKLLSWKFMKVNKRKLNIKVFTKQIQ